MYFLFFWNKKSENVLSPSLLHESDERDISDLTECYFEI